MAPDRVWQPTHTHDGQRRTLAQAVLLVGLLLSVALPAAARSAAGQTASATTLPVPVLTIDGSVTPAVADRVRRVIGDTGPDEAAAILLDVRARSGTATATDEVVAAIDGARVPVVTWISSDTTAAGAGAVVALAGDVAAMAPDGRLDLAGQFSHTANPFDDERPLGVPEDLRVVATAHHRPASALTSAAAADGPLTGKAATAQGIIDFVAPNPAAALDAANGLTVAVAGGEIATLATVGAAITTTSPTIGERIRALLADPTFAYLLLCFGAIGLVLELSAPGITVGGVGGAIALVAAAVLLGGMPLNGTGIALVLGGLLLVVIDLFVPSLGLLSIGGLASFVIGSYVLFDGDGAGYGINPVAIWAVTGCLIVFLLAVGGSGLTMLRRRPVSGRDAIIGQIGEVRATLAPEGLVFIDGEIWRAHAMTLHRTAAAPIMPVGTTIRVTGIDGLLLEVRAATDAEIRQAVAARASRNNPRDVVAPAQHLPGIHHS